MGFSAGLSCCFGVSTYCYKQADWPATWLTCTWPAALVLLRVREVQNQLLVQLLGLALLLLRALVLLLQVQVLLGWAC